MAHSNLPQHDIYMEDTLEGRRQLEALFDYFAKGMSPICHFDYQCLIPIGLQMRTFVTKCIEDAEKDEHALVGEGDEQR